MARNHRSSFLLDTERVRLVPREAVGVRCFGGGAHVDPGSGRRILSTQSLKSIVATLGYLGGEWFLLAPQFFVAVAKAEFNDGRRLRILARLMPNDQGAFGAKLIADQKFHAFQNSLNRDEVTDSKEFLISFVPFAELLLQRFEKALNILQ